MPVAAESLTRGTVIIVQLPKDVARPAVVVRSDLWIEGDNLTVIPLTGSDEDFKMVRAYIRVPEREGEGMETMIAETDRMQFCERDKVGKIIGQLNRAEMADIDRGLRL